MHGLVTIVRRGVVAVVSLDDRSRRNVLSAQMVREVGAAFDDLEADPKVQAVVVTGAGSTFCAGAELATLEQAAEGHFDLVREVYGGFLRVLHSPLLTIAAVNGPAVGAGFNLALACDVRIASESARFVCRFSELGIFPGGGHTWLLTRLVGHQQAVMGLLLGKAWDSGAAREIGLVADVVPDGDLLAAATSLAAGLDNLEPEYTRRLLKVLRSSPTISSHAEALEVEAEHQEWSTRRAPFLEGLSRIKASIARR